MLAPRRLLPSMSSLLALEAVDRLGSASAAADELSLTHSAISRQIKVLEGQLGTQLVLRDGVRLKSTSAAHEYCEIVRTSLKEISSASLKLRANPLGGSLNLAILPTFGMHWLAPRLSRFGTACPEVTVNLSSRLEPFDFAREEFDAAIHYGKQDWQGVHYLHIADEYVMPVCAPGFIDEELTDPAQLLRLPLLHLETRDGAWEEWFRQYGTQVDPLPGMLFDQFSTMAQGAVHGLGVALLPSYLAASEIKAGRLTAAFGSPVRASGNYFLVWPARDKIRAPLEKFVTWVRTHK